MIITNVCLLLEALSIVICLHHLYGEKFRLDIATVSFLSVDMIIMTAINYFELARIYTMVIYPIIILYCGIRFGFQVKRMVVNIIVSVVLVGVIQLIIAFLVCYFLGLHSVVNVQLLMVGAINFIIILIVIPKCKMKQLSIYLQDSERILKIAIGMSVLAIFLGLTIYKKIWLMEVYQTILLFGGIGFVLILSGQLIKYKMRATESEAELKIHLLYSESFQGLIDDMRIKQHEFDNHINTIYSLHYSCNTFEELVESQRRYCDNITEGNRFSKLLNLDNAVISGFLYKRFVEIDKMGIDVDFHVILNGQDMGIPIYKIIEILGDLINNAVEALQAESERNRMYVEIIEKDDFFVEVRNESPYIEYDMLGKFFNKGYSKKGENRGLGLYNIKKICEEYDLLIVSKWIEMDGKGWLIFKIGKEN